MESESALHCGAVKSERVSWFKVAETRESVLGLFKTLKRLCYQEFPRIKTPKPHGLTHFLQCGSLDNTFESTSDFMVYFLVKRLNISGDLIS